MFHSPEQGDDMTRGKCLITESALHVKQDKLIHIKCCVVNIYVNHVQKY